MQFGTDMWIAMYVDGAHSESVGDLDAGLKKIVNVMISLASLVLKRLTIKMYCLSPSE